MRKAVDWDAAAAALASRSGAGVTRPSDRPAGGSAPRRYVVAHNRDRDFYQVALALEERDALSALVTDYFDDGRSASSRLLMSRILAKRYRAPIRSRHVRNCWECVALQLIERLDRRRRVDWFNLVDRRLGVRARRAAIADKGADLLIYHNYALEAFSAPALAGRVRHLFLYHPHPRLNHAILSADFDRFGIGRESLDEEATTGARVDRLDRELALADHVLCASSLSARSVRHAGISPAAMSVVPYGSVAGRITYREGSRHAAPFRFLFVGQAVQRKGLHHLLMVWRAMRPAGAELILVCSRNRDGILDDLPPGVVLHANVSTGELAALYRSAHCFVLPALVEGFGLVLLEALQAGCFTIFSNATGLTDCAVPDYAGREVAAGDLDGLRAALEQTMAAAARGDLDHAAIAGFAATRSAERFRAELREAVGSIRKAAG